MDGSDDVRTRSEILGMKRLQGIHCEHCRQDEFESSSHVYRAVQPVKNIQKDQPIPELIPSSFFLAVGGGWLSKLSQKVKLR